MADTPHSEFKVNPKILELAEQAGLGVRNGGIVLTRGVDPAAALERLAILVMEECVTVCRSDDWEDQGGWGRHYARNIKRRFGRL